MKRPTAWLAVAFFVCSGGHLLAQNLRVGADQKGSLLFWSKVELRWNADGVLVEDTVLSLLNDYPADVRVQLYFINGDEELDPIFSSGPLPILIAEGEPGCNFVDCAFTLTPDQPVYWSAATGNPAGCQPFDILDPDLGTGPGRPDPEGSTDRVLRGYVIGWAIDNVGNEIYWNHLSGKATIVNYADTTAWEYGAWAFQSRISTAMEPLPLVIHPLPGVLNMDGVEYDQSFDMLLFDFFGAGSLAFSRSGNAVTVDTDLTLHLITGDFRENSVFPFNPVTTKAHFDIWNSNERKLSNTRRCITCWDQTLISNYGIPNNMRVMNLQTDKGKARIDGKQANECEENCFRQSGELMSLQDIIELLGDLFGDIEIRCSQDASLLGVAAKHLTFMGGARSVAGETLVGMGRQTGRLVYEEPPCDDGFFCNGEEEFDIFSGLCVAEPPCFPRVDGCATYTGACNEDLDQCVVILNHAACSDGQFCNGIEVCDPDNPDANSANCFRPGNPCDPTQEFCDETLDRCVECTNDAHCADTPATPFCNVAAGLCVECITALHCNDGNSCTTDTCEANACVNDPQCVTVTDCGFNLCQIGSCSALGCCGAVSKCPATIGGCRNVVGCDLATGDCITQDAPTGTPCEIATDATTCNGGCDGMCNAGDCVECIAPTDCDDGDDCTADSCTNGQCANDTLPDATPCDDNNACTSADDCQNGVCAGDLTVVCVSPPACREPTQCNPSTGDCDYPVSPDGTPCDDGDGCSQADQCVNGVCSSTGGPVICTALDQCHDIGTCDPSTGLCTNPTKPDGTPCNDGDACTSPDTCEGGQCTGATGTEVCNGLDDDCNGTPDDVAGIGDPCTGGGTNTTGECEAEFGCTGSPGPGPNGLTCQQTVFPSAEVCDGLDNNCNGVNDEGFGTITCGVGECERTVPSCVGGVPQNCTPGSPTTEVCNGDDDDCDGVADDGACGPNSVCMGTSCVCNPDFLDCNGLSADGCEVDSQTDPDHCGGCNQPCPAGTGCAGGSCQLLADGQACTADDQCSSNFCVDGVCCNEACEETCEACDLAGSVGSCTLVPANTDPNSECPGSTTCNGIGACFQANGTGCSTDDQCQSTFCVDGVCCNQVCLGTCQACSAALTGGANGVCDDVSNGVSDPPGCASPSTCNGSGQCSQAQGTACSDPGNCASGFCVDGFCCDTTCDQTCEACSAAKKGSGTDGVCGDIAAATDPDSECTGSSTCDGLGGCSNPNGSACITSGECDSGFCVDTVCCNTACTGVCEGCNLAAHVGTCTLVPSGLDDADTCTPTSTRDCNGAGLCLDTEGQPCTTAGECASGFCVDGFCCNTACSGTCEACSAAKKGSGSDGTCGAISPGSDPDNECTGASCNGAGACRLPNGQICGTGTECESTLCIDGVCCNTACSSTCQACNLAGSPGTCTNVPANTDPGNECAGGDCNGAGACEQANGAACSQPTQCISGFCVDGFCCDTACNALCQACSATLKGSGANGTCGLIAPGTDPQNECPGTNDCDITGGCSP